VKHRNSLLHTKSLSVCVSVSLWATGKSVHNAAWCNVTSDLQSGQGKNKQGVGVKIPPPLPIGVRHTSPWSTPITNVEQRRDRSRLQVTDFISQWPARRGNMVAGQTDGGKSYLILFITWLIFEGALLPLSMMVAQRRSGLDGGKKNNFYLIISKP